jgi:hypothetical protein
MSLWFVTVIGSRIKCLPVYKTVVETQRYELVFLPETDGRTDGQGNETVETKYTLKQHQASVRILLCPRGILPL